MKKDIRANRWILNGMAFVILLPVILSPQQMIQLHKQIDGGLLFNLGNWLGLLVFVLGIALYVTSLILVLWKGRLLLAIIALFLAVFSLEIFVPILQKSSEPGPRQLAIQRIPGVKVYCNDVYLGETPFEVSETEFHEKVKPWDTPPRQKMVIGEEFIQNIKTHDDGLANTELRWFYVPYYYFDRHPAFDQPGFSSYDDAAITGYWWRFERDGCAGFTSIRNMVPHSSGDGRRLRIWTYPLQYPSVQPYLRHLLHDLKRSNYQPSVGWRAHVGNSSKLLFRHVHEIGQRDPRVMRALEMAIQTEFGIYKGMSVGAWEAVLDEVMLRVKERGAFSTLSPETMVMDLMRPHNMKLIESRFLELLSQSMDSRSALSLRDSWGKYSWAKSGYGGREPIEFRLLEYAVLKSSPPALFKRLVYESRRGERFLNMVGSYSRPEAQQLVRQYLNNFAHSNPVVNFISPSLSRVHKWKAFDVAAELQIPALERELRRFLLKYAQDDPETSSRNFHEFVYARLERRSTGEEADSLAEWVAESIPLREDRKLRLLSRINSVYTYRYVRDMVLRQPSYQNVVVRNLIHHPNPSLDLFLIEAYQAESANVKFGGFAPITPPQKYLGNPRKLNPLIRAMLLCDTPRTRTFLERLWNSDDSNKISLLEAIKQEAPNHYPHLYRWTARISQIEDAGTRLAAIPVLDQIDTPESSEILEEWTLNSDASVKREAERALANYRERSRRTRELLAGNIKPDDLLVGQTAYVWNGKNYVPEAAVSGNR